jgi:hypothetical protein
VTSVRAPASVAGREAMRATARHVATGQRGLEVLA